jgi:hypothetical protein
VKPVSEDFCTGRAGSPSEYSGRPAQWQYQKLAAVAAVAGAAVRETPDRHTMDDASTPWYRRRYKGKHAQALWQLGFATTAMIAFVILPTSLEFIMSKEREKHLKVMGKKNTGSNDNIRKMVYENRMALRKFLDEKNV